MKKLGVKMLAEVWNYRRDLNTFDREHEFKMFKEEYCEFLEAIGNDDIIEMYDGLADMMFVLKGAEHKAFMSGVKREELQEMYYILNKCKNYVLNEISSDTDIIDSCYFEVCRSNATKGEEKVDGKIIKGDFFQPPDIKGILEGIRVFK
jgi:hypothetical protein